MREDFTQAFLDTGVLDPALIEMLPSPGWFRVVTFAREPFGYHLDEGEEFNRLDHAKAEAQRMVLQEDPPYCTFVINDMGELLYSTREAVQ